MKFEQAERVGQCRSGDRWSGRPRDTVLRLARRGALGDEQLTAALELERCILSTNYSPAASRYEQSSALGKRKRVGPGGEGSLIGQIEQRRALKRWADRLKAERGGRDAIRVTLEVIMGEGLGRIDQRYRRRRGWARLRLNEGLKIFGAIQKKT